MDESDNEWYFTKENLANTPSIKDGYESYFELEVRVKSALLIQEIGEVVYLPKKCIYSAIVYIHRFFMFHSIKNYEYKDLSMSSLYLATKVHKVKLLKIQLFRAYLFCVMRGLGKLELYEEMKIRSVLYKSLFKKLKTNENILIETLKSGLEIESMKRHLLYGCEILKASKEFKQVSICFARTVVQFTTMCVQYPPKFLACLSLAMSIKHLNYPIPNTSDGIPWYTKIDNTFTLELLQEMINQYKSSHEQLDSFFFKKYVLQF